MNKGSDLDNMSNIKEKEQLNKIKRSYENYKYVYNSNNSKFIWLGNWMEKESIIFKKEVDKKTYIKPNFKRGEIIKVDFGINVGSELSNTHFAIVLNSDDNNNVDNITVLPLTSKPGYKRINLGNLLKPFDRNNKYNKDTFALITQITTISKKRIFKDKIRCYCKKEIMKTISEEIINYLVK